MDDKVIDVVVPVYDNFCDAQRLFTHLEHASNRGRCRIIVVDDASTESPDLVLPHIGGHIADVRLVRNETNRGFAATVNSAIRESRHDVVLLNTDTLVFEGWIDRLMAVSRTSDRVATVTPLSNAATILSYPTFPEEFKASLETDWQSIDRFCAEIAARPVEIPTGVGFCMLVRRSCIEAVGLFDEAAFARGYGEECDFCRRAATAGWVNLVAPDVFVWHRGEGSFQASALDLRERAQAILRERHPDYHKLVAAFIRRDPLRDVRRQIDLARLSNGPRPRSLHLRASAPTDAGSNRTNLYFERRPSWVTRVWRPTSVQFSALPNLPAVTAFTPFSKLTAFLTMMRIDEIVVYRLGLGLLGWRIRRAAFRLGIRERAAEESNHERRPGIQP